MTTQTLISSTTRVRGSIVGADDLTIDGHVTGNVRIDGDLHLDTDARIDGNVQAHTVVVHGTIKGDINASAHLTLAKTARVKGALTTPRLRLEDGAMVSGEVMVGESTSTTRKSKKSAPTAKTALPASDEEDSALPEGVVPRKVKVKRS